MPTIKPFCGIRPNPEAAARVTLELENLSLDEAKIIRHENPYSFVNMLVPRLDNLFLRGSKTELAFKKISENFEDFLTQGILVGDSSPSLYIYRISRAGNTKTGVWTLTAVNDYLDGSLKPHELTRPETVESLAGYLLETGIDANPVLITYRYSPWIDRLLKRICIKPPDMIFSGNSGVHSLWRVHESSMLDELIKGFARVSAAYIADGHHRAAAAAHAHLTRHTGSPGAGQDYFTSVYMSADELDIYPFHRLVKMTGDLSSKQVKDSLSQLFRIERSPHNRFVSPGKRGEIGMYLKGEWYVLTCPDQAGNDDPLETLDVTVLQNNVLDPVFGITDPSTDQRIRFAGGYHSPANLAKEIDSGNFDVLFTLHPVTTDEMMTVADAGKTLPPKSTRFEPKFPAGLLIHKSH